MSVVELVFLIDIDKCFFLPDDQQIANELFENRCVSKTYIIVLRPIFGPTYKEKKHVEKYVYKLYITNWSYSYKVGIF